VNDPVVLLPVEEKIARPGRGDERNRQNRIAAAEVRDHARVAVGDGYDRSASFGQHQLESLLAEHATGLGRVAGHVEVGLEKT
jgi:hypothetical protein